MKPKQDKTFYYIDSVLSAISRCCYHVFALIPNNADERHVKVYGDTESIYGASAHELSDMHLKDFLARFYNRIEVKRLYDLSYEARNFISGNGISPQDAVLAVDLNIVQPDGTHHLVNHKYTPIMVSDDGVILWSMVTLSMPVSDKEFSDVWLMAEDGHSVFAYKDGQWAEDVMRRCTGLEQKILEHLASGLSQKEVAYKLGCSEDNVKARCTNICRKIRASNTLEAIMKVKHFNFFPKKNTKRSKQKGNLI